MAAINIKPKDGYLVPDLELRDNLPSDGRVVNESPYWNRRIADGDVIVIPAAAEPSAKSKK